ncbi:hypothetical protein [Rhizobium jaguaris]|uniref:Uncharacterized protein n=1 Tax=Rhizobium jaguaris TaxID=1312183 RepID=A0A387G847_9HYPH|nr:hypothetical protein [Rhizobium jaguaris]AYG64334.1 hypothetical protein CCGE525_36895 [Rhizobium jaguaris]
MSKSSWNAKRKEVKLSKLTGHASKSSRLIEGRVPSNTKVFFTPAELFGAMAQCSSRLALDQQATQAHVEACRLLIARHVEEDSDDFAFLESVRGLKDYLRKSMTALVGDGIAYLQMIADGYRWVDHFENYTVHGDVDTDRTPDFIFSRSSDDFVALAESKATKGSSKSAFDKTVREGYSGQVEPYLAIEIGSFIASHGFAIGSWMTSDKKAEVFIHHTQVAQPDCEGGGLDPDKQSDPSSIRFGNYCGVLTLLFGTGVGEAARARTWRPSEEVFVTVRWLKKTWIVGEFLIERPEHGKDDELAFQRLPVPVLKRLALELETARKVFGYIEAEEAKSSLLENLPEFDEILRGAAKASGGAIFPDGFAVLGRGEDQDDLQWRKLPPQNPVNAVSMDAATERLLASLKQNVDNRRIPDGLPYTPLAREDEPPVELPLQLTIRDV